MDNFFSDLSSWIEGMDENARRFLISAGCVFAIVLPQALTARLVIHIGPVPVTLQVFFVLLSGMALGPILGAISQLSYLMAGIAGLPVFSSPPYAGAAYVLGPTGGYLIGFIFGALVCGALSSRFREWKNGMNTLPCLSIAGVAGLLFIYVFGFSWLFVWVAGSGKGLYEAVSFAWKAGIKPFVIVDLIKVGVAALSVSGARILSKNFR